MCQLRGRINWLNSVFAQRCVGAALDHKITFSLTLLANIQGT
jgi:hypothetical protein